MLAGWAIFGGMACENKKKCTFVDERGFDS